MSFTICVWLVNALIVGVAFALVGWGGVVRSGAGICRMLAIVLILSSLTIGVILWHKAGPPRLPVSALLGSLGGVFYTIVLLDKTFKYAIIYNGSSFSALIAGLTIDGDRLMETRQQHSTQPYCKGGVDPMPVENTTEIAKRSVRTPLLIIRAVMIFAMAACVSGLVYLITSAAEQDSTTSQSATEGMVVIHSTPYWHSTEPLLVDVTNTGNLIIKVPGTVCATGNTEGYVCRVPPSK